MQYEFDEKTIAQMDYLSKISVKISEWEFNHPDQELPHTMAWEREYADTMIRTLESAAYPVWNRVKTPDGYEIDSHREIIYYDTLAHLTALRQTNAQYLSTEEIKSYEFSPVNIESLKEQFDKCESYDEASRFTLDVFRSLNDTSFANRQLLNEFLREAREDATLKPTQLELDFKKSQEEWTAKRAIEEAAAREKRESSFLYRTIDKLLEGKDTLMETGSRFVDSVKDFGKQMVEVKDTILGTGSRFVDSIKGFGQRVFSRFSGKTEEEQIEDVSNDFVTASNQESINEEQQNEIKQDNSQQDSNQIDMQEQQKINLEKEPEELEQGLEQ